MSIFLKEIIVENFKSFNGKITIGPLHPFTAVIGPNGSGKSNFMDAISFVMGEKTNKLRVRRLNELIHGSSVGRPLAESASVTAVFRTTSGTERRFKRTVQNASSEYRIDDTIFGSHDYLDELCRLGINVKAKNFLIFQGSMEEVALMNSDSLTGLLEEISTSAALKPEYERLMTEKLQAEKAVHFAFQKKKGIAADKKLAKIELKEAERFQQLRNEYIRKDVELQLFRLYHIEKRLKNLEDDQDEKRKEIAMAEKEKYTEEALFKDKKKEAGTLNRQLAKLEQDLREAELMVTKKKPQFIKIKENVEYLRRKVGAVEKSLDKARHADEAHAKDIEELEEELNRVKGAKAAYEASIEGPSSDGEACDIILSPEQIREYNRLKEETAAESARHLQLLESTTREQKLDQDRLDNETRKMTDIEDKIKQKRLMQQEAEKRIERSEESGKTSRALLNALTKQRDELRITIGSSTKKIEDIERELENISAELGDATIDRHDLLRSRKRAEVVENLKEIHPGVYDRILNLCKPIHHRYNVAVTKVLGRNMDAIVVDTEKTARDCIQYLKSCLNEPEIFLPLDYIQPKPLKERLRCIENPPNVKLIYDVLHFYPKAVERAVLYVTRNALVCETAEDASAVSYDMETNVRYDCVALDGSFFQRSGIISGGTSDLQRRAKRWDEKEMAQLKLRKEKLTEELRDSLMKSRRESDLTTIELRINGLIAQVRYSDADLLEAKKNLDKLKVELMNLLSERDELKPVITDIEHTMLERDKEIRKIQKTIDNLEDRIFDEFCKQIGISNIRQYEERELLTQQERDRRRMDFENQCNRIITQLEFEKKRDTESNITRWQKALEDAQTKLESARQAEIDLKAEMHNDEMKMRELEVKVEAKRIEVNQKEKDLTKQRQAVHVMSKNINIAQRHLNTIDVKIDKLRADRHDILIKCKMEDITIPILEGNIEDVSSCNDSTNEIPGTSREQRQRENEIKIDYNLLPDELKDIEEGSEQEKIIGNLKKAMSDLNRTIEQIRAPSMKADEKFCSVVEKLQETNVEFLETCNKAKKINAQFDKVKNERYERFMSFYDHVVNEIDSIYKGLVRDQSAQAYLDAENPEEPYLSGITFNCVAPGKRFQTISNLSGGEKTVAALALLFAINSLRPSPFFVLDEIDAALDNANVNRVTNYIREKSPSIQMIVISLKDELFSKADALVGIAPDDSRECLKSKVFTLKLEEYKLETEL